MKKDSTVIPTDLTPLPNDDAVGRLEDATRVSELTNRERLYDSPRTADLRSLLNRLERAEGGGGEGVSQSQPGYDGERAASAEAALAAAERRLRYLEDKLLEIACKDWHGRTPPKPRADGGMRGWAGHSACWALTGLNGSYHGDADIRAALEAERRKPWVQKS